MINNNTLQLESETTTGLYDKVITRTYEAGEQRTYFHYSDEGLVGEYDATGTEIKTYGYKPNSTWTTDLLFMKQGADDYFYHNDHLGTPMVMTDNNGNIVWSAVYNSFGKADVQPLSTIESNLRFPGQYYDSETGLHYNWNRHYDPAVGRYLTTDPIGFVGGDVNLYAYVGNNPVNWLDPRGLFSVKGVVDWLAGKDWGAAWVSAVKDPWVRGPTGGYLPSKLAIGLRDVGRSVPSNAAANGMHAWHAGSNAYLAQELGIIGAPIIFLGGVCHETPLDWSSFKAEQRWQGTVNHFLDSVTDIVANTFGMHIGYLFPDSGIDKAIKWGNYIPGPGEPDPTFGGRGGRYKGNPVDAWGQYP